jgi:PAS domain-containing protein
MHTAVDHMAQGLCMYDASERLVFCNTRFLEMYRLSPQVVKPGATLVDVLEHRRASGQFKQDPAEYRRTLMAAMTAGQTLAAEVTSQDGQLVAVRNTPLRSGGWVATHEDITGAAAPQPNAWRCRRPGNGAN